MQFEQHALAICLFAFDAKLHKLNWMGMVVSQTYYTRTRANKHCFNIHQTNKQTKSQKSRHFKVHTKDSQKIKTEHTKLSKVVFVDCIHCVQLKMHHTILLELILVCLSIYDDVSFHLLQAIPKQKKVKKMKK